MAVLDSQGRVISSGDGPDGLLTAWQLFARWLGIELPGLASFLRHLAGL